MGVVSQTVSCKECGAYIDESPSTAPERRIPCPSCGSTARVHHVYVEDTITMHGSLGLEGRHGQSGRPFVEAKVGDDFFRKTGKWNKLERRIDRIKRWYYEKIVDPETGQVIREKGEPLSQHQGHGSAKKSKRK